MNVTHTLRMELLSLLTILNGEVSETQRVTIMDWTPSGPNDSILVDYRKRVIEELEYRNSELSKVFSS